MPSLMISWARGPAGELPGASVVGAGPPTAMIASANSSTSAPVPRWVGSVRCCWSSWRNSAELSGWAAAKAAAVETAGNRTDGLSADGIDCFDLLFAVVLLRLVIIIGVVRLPNFSQPDHPMLSSLDVLPMARTCSQA